MSLQINSVTLGLFQTINEYAEAIKNNGFVLSGNTEDMLIHVQLSPIKKEFKLVECNLNDLGIYSEKATWPEVLSAAQKKGYSICPSEVGLALRLEYKDQPNDDWLNIGMELINNNHFRVAKGYGYTVLDGWKAQNVIAPEYKSLQEYERQGTRLIFGC
jgi:hypothetical protein